jgi:hypothetical protein
MPPMTTSSPQLRDCDPWLGGRVQARKEALVFRGEWKQLLARDEEDLHRTTPEDIRMVMKGKSVLLTMEMLAAIGYADSTLQHDLTFGFPITGKAVCTGNFVPKEVPAQLTPIMLMATARTSQQSLADSMRTSAEPGIDAAVHAETMAEVERGWLVSPFAQEEVTRRLGKEIGLRRGARLSARGKTPLHRRLHRLGKEAPRLRGVVRTKEW